MTEQESGNRLGRASEHEFLRRVLEEMEDLPSELSDRLVALVDDEDRVTAIRELLEELGK